jgi:hypothetical protein
MVEFMNLTVYNTLINTKPKGNYDLDAEYYSDGKFMSRLFVENMSLLFLERDGGNFVYDLGKFFEGTDMAFRPKLYVSADMKPISIILDREIKPTDSEWLNAKIIFEIYESNFRMLPFHNFVDSFKVSVALRLKSGDHALHTIAPLFRDSDALFGNKMFPLFYTVNMSLFYKPILNLTENNYHVMDKNFMLNGSFRKSFLWSRTNFITRSDANIKEIPVKCISAPVYLTKVNGQVTINGVNYLNTHGSFVHAMNALWHKIRPIAQTLDVNEAVSVLNPEMFGISGEITDPESKIDFITDAILFASFVFEKIHNNKSILRTYDETEYICRRPISPNFFNQKALFERQMLHELTLIPRCEHAMEKSCLGLIVYH